MNPFYWTLQHRTAWLIVSVAGAVAGILFAYIRSPFLRDRLAGNIENDIAFRQTLARGQVRAEFALSGPRARRSRGGSLSGFFMFLALALEDPIRPATFSLAGGVARSASAGARPCPATPDALPRRNRGRSLRRRRFLGARAGLTAGRMLRALGLDGDGWLGSALVETVQSVRKGPAKVHLIFARTPGREARSAPYGRSGNGGVEGAEIEISATSTVGEGCGATRRTRLAIGGR